MLIRDSQVSASAVNGIYNESEMTVQGTTVDGSGNCGTYNNAGVMHLTDVTVTNSTKRAVHNKGGETYLSQILIQSCGTHGVANTIATGARQENCGRRLDVSGCVTNIYNEGPGSLNDDP